MSLELFNALATFGTFVVIAATAIAALVQLRHARSGNLIGAQGGISRTFESPEFSMARNFSVSELPQKLEDPAFRYILLMRKGRTVEQQNMMSKINFLGNTFENLGILVKRRLIDREMTLDRFSATVIACWESLAPVAALLRQRTGDVLWENFEYLVVLSQDWRAAHPNGTYPPGVRRIDLKAAFPEAPAQYAAVLAMEKAARS